MDSAAVLALYDAQIRANPPDETGVERVWADGVLRTLGAYDFIGWWNFPAARAHEIVAREAHFFAGREVEWKVFSHDRPAGLETALSAAGYAPDPTETFLVFDLADAVLPAPVNADIDVREVTDANGVADLVAVNDAAFGGGAHGRMEPLIARLGDPSQALFVGYDAGRPVCSGRLELAPDRAFAGLYGGGTVADHRGRGAYRSLVAARAAVARQRGHRYLTVDALETSRPILERLGFEPLATIRGWKIDG